mmetsp:Transcript_5936/g.17762  ORF Transcript_5936/g.17762 Transcript_5936/m.17762 type:complete len:284 (+) Transcript_5936:469-1320(+)
MRARPQARQHVLQQHPRRMLAGSAVQEERELRKLAVPLSQVRGVRQRLHGPVRQALRGRAGRAGRQGRRAALLVDEDPCALDLGKPPEVLAAVRHHHVEPRVGTAPRRRGQGPRRQGTACRLKPRCRLLQAPAGRRPQTPQALRLGEERLSLGGVHRQARLRHEEEACEQQAGALLEHLAACCVRQPKHKAGGSQRWRGAEARRGLASGSLSVECEELLLEAPGSQPPLQRRRPELLRAEAELVVGEPVHSARRGHRARRRLPVGQQEPRRRTVCKQSSQEEG